MPESGPRATEDDTVLLAVDLLADRLGCGPHRARAHLVRLAEAYRVELTEVASAVLTTTPGGAGNHAGAGQRAVPVEERAGDARARPLVFDSARYLIIPAADQDRPGAPASADSVRPPAMRLALSAEPATADPRPARRPPAARCLDRRGTGHPRHSAGSGRREPART